MLLGRLPAVPQLLSTVIHVAMDAWIGSYTNTYTQFQTEYPLIAPIDLGSQGYEGRDAHGRSISAGTV